MKKFLKYFLLPLFVLGLIAAGVGAYYAYNWSKTPVTINGGVYDA